MTYVLRLKFWFILNITIHLQIHLHRYCTWALSTYNNLQTHKSTLKIQVAEISPLLDNNFSSCETLISVCKATGELLLFLKWNYPYAKEYVSHLYVCGITLKVRCVEKAVMHNSVSPENSASNEGNTDCIFLHIHANSERREIDRWFIIPRFLWNMDWKCKGVQ